MSPSKPMHRCMVLMSLLLQHESAVAIAYAKDQSTLFRDIVCPRDALKQALLRDYIPPGGLASYMSDEDIKIFSETFKKDTFQGPLCYYKCQMRDFNKADELGEHSVSSFVAFLTDFVFSDP